MGGGQGMLQQMEEQKRKENEALMAAGIDPTNMSDTNRQQAYTSLQQAQQQNTMDQIAQQTGFYADGTKIAPEFQTMLEDNGFLADQYRLGGDNFEDIALNQDAYNKYSENALRDGPSAATEKILEKIALQKQANIDNAARSGMAAQSQAMANLAASGGLSGGARERLAASSAREQMLGRAGARRDANLQTLDALASDEQQRIADLQNLYQMDLSNANYAQNERNARISANQFDITSALGEKEAQRNYDMNVWEQDNARIAADKQAEATRATKPSCFLEGTLIQLANGRSLPVESIDIGMEVEAGGEVIGIHVASLQEDDELYDYLGVKVTGDHALVEDEAFVRVKNSKLATRIPTPTGKKVYNFITKDHLLMINDLMFCDMQEVDDAGVSNEMALAMLNLGLREYREFVG